MSKVSLRGAGEGLAAARAHPVSPSPRQQSLALAAPSSAHRGASAGPSATGDSSKETLPQAAEQGRWQPAFPGCLRPLFLMRNKAPSWGRRVSALQVSALKAAFPEQCTSPPSTWGGSSGPAGAAPAQHPEASLGELLLSFPVLLLVGSRGG